MRINTCCLLLWFVPAIAFAGEPAPAVIEVGSKFAAADTLVCSDESGEDAKACLANLAWPVAKFTVQLEAAAPGCGDYLVRFPSPRPIGNTTNDLVSMEWYAARDAESAIRKTPAVVVVHESGNRMTVGRMIARSLSAQGLHAFLVHLPGYGARRVEGVADSDRVLPSLRQAIDDVRRARDAVVALPVVDGSNVGVQGTSLGGFVTATVAGLDRGYDRVFILLAGGNLEDVVLHGAKDAAKVRAKLVAAGKSEAQIKELAHEVEPLRLAHRMRPAGTWLFTGQFDQVVPARCSLALATAAHLPQDHHLEYPADHYSAAIYLPQVVQQIARQMRTPPEAQRASEVLHAAP